MANLTLRTSQLPEVNGVNTTDLLNVSSDNGDATYTSHKVTWGNVISNVSNDILSVELSLNGKANVSGQVFTGVISATNLSNTNTGDQDLSGKANVSGQVFGGQISATNLSGTNTGDETKTTIENKLLAANVSNDGYLTSADWNLFQGAVSNVNSVPSTYLKLDQITPQTTVGTFSFPVINTTSIISTGDITLTPSGGDVNIVGNLGINKTNPTYNFENVGTFKSGNVASMTNAGFFNVNHILTDDDTFYSGLNSFETTRNHGVGESIGSDPYSTPNTIGAFFNQSTLGNWTLGDTVGLLAFSGNENTSQNNIDFGMANTGARYIVNNYGKMASNIGFDCQTLSNASAKTTDQIGAKISSIIATGGTGSVTNNYGIFIDDVKDATTLNYAIKTGKGEVSFGDKLTVVGNVSATNLSGTNTGDETKVTIQNKLLAANVSNDGYLTSADWNTFSNAVSNVNAVPSTYLKLDQTTPQTVSNGSPTFSTSILTPEIKSSGTSLNIASGNWGMHFYNSGLFAPNNNNMQDFGSPTATWKDIYATNVNSSRINATVVNTASIVSTGDLTFTPNGTVEVIRASTSSQSSFQTWPTIATRSDFTGNLGFTFSPLQKITVTQLGRLYVAGNTQNHTIYIWDATTQTAVVTGTVLAASDSDANNFKWVSVTPYILNASKTYHITIDETSGGDAWKDLWTSTNYFNSNIKRTGYAYKATQGQYPNVINQSLTIYNAPAFKFTTEADVQITSTYDTTDKMFVTTRPTGDVTLSLSKPDQGVAISSLAVGKGSVGSGLSLDVSGSEKITSAWPQLSLTDGATTINLGINSGGGTTPSIRSYSNADLIINSGTSGTLYLGYDTGSNITAKGTFKSYPVADNTTAFGVFKADGTTNILDVDTINSRVGIGTSAPDKQLEINSATGNNLRLTYNDSDGSATNYTDFDVSSTGDLTITPSGGDMVVVGNVSATKNIYTSNVSSDHSATGDIVNDIVAGASLAFPNLVYLSSLGKWSLANATSITTCQGMFGLALETKTTDQACSVLVRGFARDDSWTWSNVGSPVYSAVVDGTMSQSTPTGADNVILMIGTAINANRIYFNPQPIAIEYKV